MTSKKPLHNPKTTEYEFLGPIGAFLMITVLPSLVYLLHLGCQPEGVSISPAFTYVGYLSYLVLAWYLATWKMG
ncbi:unnamed protein product [Rhizophagus irregularis]|nr:unnamed protein product [Rhizophagus irregularis]